MEKFERVLLWTAIIVVALIIAIPIAQQLKKVGVPING